MVSGQLHALAALWPRERPGTHCTGGFVGPRACVDEWKISSPPGFDPRIQRTLQRSRFTAALRNTNISTLVLSSCNQNRKLFDRIYVQVPNVKFNEELVFGRRFVRSRRRTDRHILLRLRMSVEILG